jgi:hypothetical protein
MFFLFFTSTSSVLFSQDEGAFHRPEKRLSITLSKEYFFDLKKDIYNPGNGVTLEYRNGMILGLGFTQFKPKQDTFYTEGYPDGSTDFGIATFKDYIVVPMYVGFEWDIYLTPKLIVMPKFVTGLYTIFYEYETYNTYARFGDMIATTSLGLSPAVKVVYRVLPTIECYFQAKWTGVINPVDATNNPNYTSIGLGFSIILE